MNFFTKKSRNLFLTFKWKPGFTALTAERYVTAEGKE